MSLNQNAEISQYTVAQSDPVRYVLCIVVRGVNDIVFSIPAPSGWDYIACISAKSQQIRNAQLQLLLIAQPGIDHISAHMAGEPVYEILSQLWEVYMLPNGVVSHHIHDRSPQISNFETGQGLDELIQRIIDNAIARGQVVMNTFPSPHI
mgnify:CR=1 FL=1